MTKPSSESDAEQDHSDVNNEGSHEQQQPHNSETQYQFVTGNTEPSTNDADRVTQQAPHRQPRQSENSATRQHQSADRLSRRHSRAASTLQENLLALTTHYGSRITDTISPVITPPVSWAARWLSLAAYVLGVLVMIAIIPFLTVLLMTAGHLGQFTAVVTVLAVTWWIAYRYRKRAKTLREATTHAQASARQQYLREQQALWNVIKSYAAWTLPIVVATCLFVAARMTGVPRTQIPGTLYTVGLFYTTGIVLLIPYTVIKIFRRDA